MEFGFGSYSDKKRGVKSIVLDKRDKNFTTKQIKHKFQFLLIGKGP